MEIRLDENEIREALAEALAKKIEYTVQPVPEDCWFNVKAGIIDGDEVDDIHEVEFCYKTDS
jgi:hypothetical protein